MRKEKRKSLKAKKRKQRSENQKSREKEIVELKTRKAYDFGKFLIFFVASLVLGIVILLNVFQ